MASSPANNVPQLLLTVEETFSGPARAALTCWSSSGTAARGHFSTKSRTYSTTLGALRAAHQREHAITTGLLPDPGGETVLVLAH